jgi:hypothetical protein
MSINRRYFLVNFSVARSDSLRTIGSIWFECLGYPSYRQLQAWVAASDKDRSYEVDAVLVNSIHEFNDEADYSSFVAGGNTATLAGRNGIHIASEARA